MEAPPSSSERSEPSSCARCRSCSPSCSTGSESCPRSLSLRSVTGAGTPAVVVFIPVAGITAARTHALALGYSLDNEFQYSESHVTSLAVRAGGQVCLVPLSTPSVSTLDHVPPSEGSSGDRRCVRHSPNTESCTQTFRTSMCTIREPSSPPCVVVPQSGFEPAPPPPTGDVLPLHHEARARSIRRR